MSKKTAIISIFLVLVFILSACSSTATTNSVSTSQQITSSSLTLQNKLGLGILKLEGTSLAVTADQANTLLPLWKAVKSLSSSSLTSATEMTALYQQIEDGLTTAQVQAIQKLSLTQTQLNTLIQQNSLTSKNSSSSSSSASSSAQSQSGGMGMDMGGAPSGSSDMSAITGQTSSDMTAITGQTSTSTTTTAQTTRTVKNSASSVSQINVVFANSVVTLLQKRIS